MRFIAPLLCCLLAGAFVRAEELSTTVRASLAGEDGQSSTPVDPARFAGEWRHVGELAATAPGALPLDFGGLLSTTTLSLRGGSADQVAVLIDGVALAPPSGGGFDLSRLPAVLVSGLEVQRGSDARLGAAAMGGALLLRPANGSKAMLTGGSLGTLGGGVAYAFDLDTKHAYWKFLLAADLRRSLGNFSYERDPTPELPHNDLPVTLERENNDALLGTMLLRAERHGTPGTLHALALLSYSERGLPGSVFSLTPDSRQDEWTGVGQIGFKRKGLSLPLTFRAGRLVTESAEFQENGLQSFSDLSASPTYERAFGRSTLRLDGLLGHETFDGENHGNRSRVRGGAGASFSYDSRLWSASAALRGERWGDAWSLVPRLGGSWKPARGWMLHANVGSGFRPPSFGELFFASGPVMPNPDLVAERAWSGDIGLRHTRRLAVVDATTALTLHGGLYRNTVVYELFSGTRAKPFNVAGSRSAGIEADLNFRGADGRWRAFEGSATFTWLETRSSVEGHNDWQKALPYRPRLRSVLRLSWRDTRFRASAEFTSTASAWANRANTRRVDGFHDLRAATGVRLIRDIWLGAEIRNALDVRERSIIEGYPLPGRVGLLHLSWEPAQP